MTAASRSFRHRSPSSDANATRPVLLIPATRLVPLGRRHPGPRVEHRAEVVRERGLPGEHHVVRLRAVHLEQAQFRLRPGAAVLREGDAGDLGVRPVLPGGRVAAVVRPEVAAVAEDGGVPAERPLPRPVEPERDALVPRRFEPQGDAVELVDQVRVGEQLAPRADVGRLRRVVGTRGRGEGQGEEQEHGPPSGMHIIDLRDDPVCRVQQGSSATQLHRPRGGRLPFRGPVQRRSKSRSLHPTKSGRGQPGRSPSGVTTRSSRRRSSGSARS